MRPDYLKYCSFLNQLARPDSDLEDARSSGREDQKTFAPGRQRSFQRQPHTAIKVFLLLFVHKKKRFLAALEVFESGWNMQT